MQEKPLVLILCTGNSCRSHLAEGILRQKAGDLIRVESAGSKPAGFVHPLAIRAMKEIGIDISGHRSKHLEEFLDSKVHTVHHGLRKRRPSMSDISGNDETVPLGL